MDCWLFCWMFGLRQQALSSASPLDPAPRAGQLQIRLADDQPQLLVGQQPLQLPQPLPQALEFILLVWCFHPHHSGHQPIFAKLYQPAFDRRRPLRWRLTAGLSRIHAKHSAISGTATEARLGES